MASIQQDANEIGVMLRDLDDYARRTADSTLQAKASALHQKLSQACVDHLDDQVDWYQAAGVASPDGGTPKGAMQTNAGVKTKPTATETN